MACFVCGAVADWTHTSRHMCWDIFVLYCTYAFRLVMHTSTNELCNFSSEFNEQAARRAFHLQLYTVWTILWNLAWRRVSVQILQSLHVWRKLQVALLSLWAVLSALQLFSACKFAGMMRIFLTPYMQEVPSIAEPRCWMDCVCVFYFPHVVVDVVNEHLQRPDMLDTRKTWNTVWSFCLVMLDTTPVTISLWSSCLCGSLLHVLSFELSR